MFQRFAFVFVAATLLAAAASGRFCAAQLLPTGGVSTAPTAQALTPEQLDRQSSDGLHIELPPRPIGRHAYVFKIKLRVGK